MSFKKTAAETNISTHTLTWSVTQLLNCHIRIYTHFNSHAHVERDVKQIYALVN